MVDSRESVAKHNSNAYAHPDLLSVQRVEGRLDQLWDERNRVKGFLWLISAEIPVAVAVAAMVIHR